MAKPYVSKIRIYPVKSLDPVEVSEVRMGTHSLTNDRAFAMITTDGHFVNGKRTGKVNELKATYDLKQGIIGLGHRNSQKITKFELTVGNEKLNRYLSNFFDLDINLIHNTTGELMDIPKTSSITIVSEASLASIQNDISEISMENMRLRFRTNIELAGVPAFWEEKLFRTPGIGMKFKIGDVEMIGVSPRARCNVPPRDPFTGMSNRSFAKAMMKSRADSLLEESDLPHFGSMYHLTVNTYLPQTQEGKLIRLDDAIEILNPINLR